MMVTETVELLDAAEVNPGLKQTSLKLRKNVFLLTKLVLLGVPDYLRPRLWMLCSGAYLRVRDSQNKNYYKNLLNAFPDYPNPYFHQIALDLHRTFQVEIDESGNTQNVQQKIAMDYIRNTMCAFTKRNPVIGYC
jgi:hypothetical protein